MKVLSSRIRNTLGSPLLAAAMACTGAAMPAAAQINPNPNPPVHVLPCPDSATRHWDKIVFQITDKKVADRLNVPHRAPLDIKVLDDPKTVSDLELKVMSFFRNLTAAPLPDFRHAIQIDQVSYAIAGCVALPAVATNGGPASCTSTVTSGPGLTTATAICGLSCPSSAHITNYTGAGNPFVSVVAPNYICNGSPSLGTSSITCAC